MEISKPLIGPDEKILDAIRKEFNEHPERLKKQIELFKEWITCESHLPKNLDDRLIENFVRLCKCDLEKAKRKFERFLAAHTTVKASCSRESLNEVDFTKDQLHRSIFLSPKLTNEGYRVVYARTPEDVEKFDFIRTLQYGMVLLNLILFEDVSAGTIAVHDLKYLTARHVAKINIKVFLDAVNMVYNASPFRVKAIHLLNVSPVGETLVNLAKKILSDKMANRILVHSAEELSRYVPVDVLPEDYGGNEKKSDEIADDIAAYVTSNDEWIEKYQDFELKGPVPPNKSDLYSFDDFDMTGSFRKLSID